MLRRRPFRTSSWIYPTGGWNHRLYAHIPSGYKSNMTNSRESLMTPLIHLICWDTGQVPHPIELMQYHVYSWVMAGTQRSRIGSLLLTPRALEIGYHKLFLKPLFTDMLEISQPSVRPSEWWYHRFFELPIFGFWHKNWFEVRLEFFQIRGNTLSKEVRRISGFWWCWFVQIY